jgi:hypothetical protein
VNNPIVIRVEVDTSQPALFLKVGLLADVSSNLAGRCWLHYSFVAFLRPFDFEEK